MAVFPDLIHSIDVQHAHHRQRNLFYEKADRLFWMPATRALLTRSRTELLQLSAAGKLLPLADYLTLTAQRAFCRVNQYMQVAGTAGSALKALYVQLIDEIAAALESSADIDFDTLEQQHIQRLRNWLLQTNPFVATLNSSLQPFVQEVVCAEYAPATQLQVLQLDLSAIREPLLDIGCGPHAYLVRYLREQGVDAYGVDRFIEKPAPWLYTGDWMTYTYTPGYWGTMLSNLSFSNHFQHHHQRSDGEYLAYAGKYMEILAALQPGGSYHYAPHLPMIETYLPPEVYHIRHHRVQDQLMCAIIQKHS
ncbi:hypothetical protein [Chitinophaga nivalis]|uniref:Class I SAM-dependent methyltransferase n=1 Tax=Chitinophaga nivalis TaxID=2991709 RepID=A0ABT3IR02_9BACT|nr:hypothetical protein [Chitinophaga nivalis]MCW3463898.1 hypothetical protein [Chitinophaga nivalis]MCW3486412.1 hypothetical protein [Chitinophaga nivalis]